MYKKIKIINKVTPNTRIVSVLDNKIIVQTSNKINDLSSYSLVFFDLITLKSSKVKTNARYTSSNIINDELIAFVRLNEEIDILDLHTNIITQKPIVKKIRINTFRPNNDFFVFEYINSKMKKGGVFQLSKKRILFEDENFFPFGFIGDYLFDLKGGKNGFIKLFNYINGKIIWEFKLENYIIGLNEKESNKIHLLNLWDGELIVQIGSTLLLFIEVSTGKIKEILDFRKENKPQYFGEIYRNLVLVGDKLCMLQSFYYMEIDLKTKKVNRIKPLMIGMTRNELRSSYYFTWQIHSKGNIIFIAKKENNNPTYIGIFDITQQEISWVTNINIPINDKPIIRNNIMCIMDIERTLHIFEQSDLI